MYNKLVNASTHIALLLNQTRLLLEQQRQISERTRNSLENMRGSSYEEGLAMGSFAVAQINGVEAWVISFLDSTAQLLDPLGLGSSVRELDTCALQISYDTDIIEELARSIQTSKARIKSIQKIERNVLEKDPAQIEPLYPEAMRQEMTEIWSESLSDLLAD